MTISDKGSTDGSIRLNRFLASCAVGSRRKVEELITAGRVKINGQTVTDLATRVQPATDDVLLDNQPLSQRRVLYYVLVNKPKGYITTVSDPFGRPTIMLLLPEKYRRAGVFPVGRLDRETEGLLLLTNDGELAHRLAHPSFESNKEYLVHLDKPVEENDLQKIRRGMKFREFTARPCEAEFIDEFHNMVRMIIHDGKNRQIRITFKKLGYKIEALTRVSIGPITLGSLRRGSHRDLRSHEVKKLKQYLGMNA
jgi:pseudouridine synthase